MTGFCPYVGVSGVGSVIEAREIRSFFLEHNLARSGKAQGGIGVCLTAEILTGRALPPPRYISLEDLSAFYKIPQDFGFVCVHYTPDLSLSLKEQLTEIVKGADVEEASFPVIQINNCIPDAYDLQEITSAFPSVRFIMQVSDLSCLSEAHSCVFSMLLDESRGRGLAADMGKQAAAISALRQRFGGVKTGIAGGIHAGNVFDALSFLRQELGLPFDVSVDSESGLRDERDNLSMPKVARYISEASRLYHSLVTT